MIGQDFQDRLDAIVADLQTGGKGQTINIMFRNANNSPSVLPLSSDVNGIVDAAQLAAIQAFINPLKGYADTANASSTPVTEAGQAFRNAEYAHRALILAAQTANNNLRVALSNDNTYQAAKTALANARLNPDYVVGQADYQNFNVSENYAALQAAKGEYVV